MAATTLTLQAVRQRREELAEKNNFPVIPDHLGPLQRLELVKQDPNSMNIISQRVMDGESLKQIAESWGLPVRPFCQWVADDPERAMEYDAALKIRADEYYHETILIADACDDKDAVPVRPFCQWVADDPERAMEYDAALKIRADEYYHETILIADACDDKDAVPV